MEVNVQGDSDGTKSDQFNFGYSLVSDFLTLIQVVGTSTFSYTLQQ